MIFGIAGLRSQPAVDLYQELAGHDVQSDQTTVSRDVFWSLADGGGPRIVASAEELPTATEAVVRHTLDVVVPELRARDSLSELARFGEPPGQFGPSGYDLEYRAILSFLLGDSAGVSHYIAQLESSSEAGLRGEGRRVFVANLRQRLET